MNAAFAEAEAAGLRGEVPVGAVIATAGGQIVFATGNRTIELSDPTAHAETLAIRAACALRGEPRLPDCDLYVTLEPCALCAAAISFARIRRVYFAAWDAKGGAIDHGPRFFRQATCLHRPETHGGFNEDRATDMLRAFFKERR